MVVLHAARPEEGLLHALSPQPCTRPCLRPGPFTTLGAPDPKIMSGSVISGIAWIGKNQCHP